MFLSRLEIVLCDPFEKYLNGFSVNEKDVFLFLTVSICSKEFIRVYNDV